MFSIFTILKVFADYSRERKKEEDNLFLQIWSEFVDNPFSIKLKLPTGFRDDMKMAFANTFLISQGYPAINQRKLVSSTIKLIEKLTETFTSYEVDFRQYEKTIKYKPNSIRQFYFLTTFSYGLWFKLVVPDHYSGDHKCSPKNTNFGLNFGLSPCKQSEKGDSKFNWKKK